MTRENKIWRALATRVAKLYCPELKQAESITLKNCREMVMLAISNYWELDYDLMPREQSFYNAARGHSCGCAMCEMLAIFCYAFTDKQCALEMPGLYLAIEGKERIQPSPYWDRFVEEYNKEHKPHAPKSLPLRPLIRTLKKMPKNDLKKVFEVIKKELKEKGRK